MACYYSAYHFSLVNSVRKRPKYADTGGRKMIKFCGRPLWMAPYTTPEKPQATTVTPEMNEQVYRKLSSLRDR